METVADRSAVEEKIVYRFTESVPYLLNRLGVSVAERFTRRLESFNVTLPMYRVMAVLRQSGAHTLGELSEMVSIEISTLSRLVGTMVRRGFVTRTRPAENGRFVKIDLTDTGCGLTDKLMPIAMEFEDTLIENLDPEVAQTLKTLLSSMYSQLRRL